MGEAALVYRRISMEESSGLGLASQEERCRAYASMRGLDVLDVLTDDGVSGGTPLYQRPGGSRVIQLTSSRRQPVRHVIALRLDRAFRNAADCLAVTQAWDKRGIALHIVDLGGAAIETSTATGRFMLTVLAGAAEMEKNLAAERTRCALAVKRSRGEFCGGEPPFGWRLRRGELVEEEDEQRTLALIVRLRTKGRTFEEIAGELNRRGVSNRGKGTWRKGRVFTLYTRQGAA